MASEQDKEDKAALDALESEAKEFDKVWPHCPSVVSCDQRH